VIAFEKNLVATTGAHHLVAQVLEAGVLISSAEKNEHHQEQQSTLQITPQGS
jgi:hypothetical protein